MQFCFEVDEGTFKRQANPMTQKKIVSEKKPYLNGGKK